MQLKRNVYLDMKTIKQARDILFKRFQDGTGCPAETIRRYPFRWGLTTRCDHNPLRKEFAP